MRSVLALALAVASTAALGLLPGSALAARKACPARSGTLASQHLGRVWHQGRSLYACTIAGGVAPKARRMGPWTPGTRVAFDGDAVAWTTRITRAGAQVDRVWAGHASNGRRWLSGAQAVPASDGAPAGEARVLALRTLYDATAWVTDASQLALASQAPQDDAGPTTLATPSMALTPDADRVLAGAWPDTPAASLAGTLQLEQGQGESDECGGTDVFTASVQPTGAPEPVGAAWASDFLPTSSACDL